MRESGCRILVFARAPIPGEVKTRLIPSLGPDGAAALHARLVRRTVALAAAAGDRPVELWSTPDTRHSLFQALAVEYALDLRQQQGRDLGERMHHALGSALARCSRALLIGTDCPELVTGDLRDADAILAQGSDVVLGPAADGGYVLIGLTRPSPTLFTAMPWGGSAVLESTRKRMLGLGLCWRELEVRHDLDRPEDLARFGWLVEGEPER